MVRFASQFPPLFALDKRKSCSIAERIIDNNLNGAWKRIPNIIEEVTVMHELRGFTSSNSLTGELDVWKSRISNDGRFYVSDVQTLIDSKMVISSPNPTVWLKLAPVKVICFVWRACVSRIPSAMTTLTC